MKGGAVASIITMTMAMDDLKEAVAKYADFEAKQAAALADRNRAIRDAAQYISVSELQRVTKLSRQRIYRIIAGRLD